MALSEFILGKVEVHLPGHRSRKIKISEFKGLDGVDGVGTNGREIELQATSDFIQWRYASGGEWTNLIALNEDPTNKYKITDIDPTEGNSYFGYLDAEGKWYIMNLTVTTARYIRGDDHYADSWGIRGSLNYDYFSNVF
jgi:hypothetical protein